MPSVTKRLLAWFFPTAIGAGAALILAPLVGSDTRAADEELAAVVHPRTKAGSPASVDPQGSFRRGSARWAPRHADAGVEADEAVADDDEEAEIVDLESATPEAQYARLLTGRSHHESRWNGESVDADWAGDAQANLHGDLERIAENLSTSGGTGFDVDDVTCRSTICVARIQWASATQAVEHAERIAMASYEEKCGIFLLGPSPEVLADAAAFTQEVYFDCGERRS